MFFLIRVAFWLSIVILLLPTGKSGQSANGPQFATEAITAAGAAVADMSQFCARQPTACEAGSQAAVAFGQKAQASAKMIYEFLTDRLGPEDPSPGAQRSTAAPGTSPTQDTLTAADRNPAWRAPTAPRPELQARRAS